MQPGRAQRRRQVADRDGAEPALGRRRLAGIVDDEGIDHRQAAEQRVGEAGRRERHRLAGQPFQRAVRAEMDQRVDALDLAQPEVEARHRHGAAAGRGRDRSAWRSAARPRSGCTATMIRPKRASRSAKAPSRTPGRVPARPRRRARRAARRVGQRCRSSASIARRAVSSGTRLAPCVTAPRPGRRRRATRRRCRSRRRAAAAEDPARLAMVSSPTAWPTCPPAPG